jgi:hypothetical protein
MTVIAWDGVVMASDTMGVVGDEMKVYDQDKFMISEDGKVLIGGAGDPAEWKAMAEWYLFSQEDEMFPEGQNGSSAIIVVDLNSQQAFIYAGNPRPYEELRMASPLVIGSGRSVAVGAMEMGANAVSAVAVAIHRSLGCGGVIQPYSCDTGTFRRLTPIEPEALQAGLR